MSWTGLRKISLLLACIGMLLAAAPTWARDTQYSATVPVADRSEAARGAAVRQALGEVLTRLSGDPAVLRQAGSAALLSKANRYLQQYQYEGDEMAGVSGALALRAGFDGSALEADMRQQGLPLWGRTRPPALVWLAVDDGNRRYLLAADAADPVYSELSKAASRQGLELILPMNDLQDQTQLSYNDVADGALEKVRQASQRYASQAILVGRLQASGSQWGSQWRLNATGGDSHWQTGTATLGVTLDQALAKAAEGLTTRAPARNLAGQGASQLTLRVEGVAGLSDYARISEYLNGLAPVRSVVLDNAQGQRLEFRLDVQGGAAGLEQTLALGGILEHAAATDGAGVPTYRLRR